MRELSELRLNIVLQLLVLARLVDISTALTMADADDDLDAFFDDIDNAVKEVQEEEEATAANKEDKNEADTSIATKQPSKDEVEEERPAKRIKVSVASSVPVKSIVASSVPVTSISAPPSGNLPMQQAAAVPPPPNNNYTTNNNTQQQPPLPPNNQNIAKASDPTKVHVRSAAGTTWQDPTLVQWPTNDFRLFVGNLAKDLKQGHLENHFKKYPSFHMARVMYNKTDGKSRGYGFVSLLDAKDCAKAIREMDQSWLGSRPIKVKLSEWKDRDWKEVQKKNKYEKSRKKKGW